MLFPPWDASKCRYTRKLKNNSLLPASFFCAKFDNLTIFLFWGENSRQICKFQLQFRLNFLILFLWGENSPTSQSLKIKIKSLVETKAVTCFLGGEFSPFFKKTIKKICRKFPGFLKKRPKSSQLPSIWKSAQDFILSYFEYRQNWLNTFMYYCHLSNITKLKRKKREIFLLVGKL